MDDYSGHIGRVEGIEDIEEVVSVWWMSLGEVVREVLHELLVILHVWEQGLD